VKQFSIIKYKPDAQQLMFRDLARRREGIAYNQTQAATNGSEGDINEASDVYFADTIETATMLVEVLSAKYSQYSWIIAETQVVYFRDPGPVRQAKFTDKGLMPV